MKPEEVYDAWKHRRRAIDAAPGFADRVMRRIHAAEDGFVSPGRGMSRLVDWVSVRPWAQAAAIVLMTAVALSQSALLLRIGIG